MPTPIPRRLGRNVSVWLAPDGSYVIDFADDLSTTHILRRDKVDDLNDLVKRWIFFGTVPEDAKSIDRRGG